LPTKLRHTTHQTQHTEVVIRYRFHPRAGERFWIARRYVMHDELCFVLHPAQGTCTGVEPLAVPAWMLDAAAQHEIVSVARVPVAVLAELRGLVDVALSFLAPTVGEGGGDARTQGSATRAVRRQSAGCRPDATARSAGRSTAASDAVAAHSEQSDGPGERR